jgi:hypothetical protein
VEFGNLLSLPVSSGLLYVEPVYVKASQGQGYPLLRKVLASFGNTTVMENTLADALAAVFQGTGTSSGGTEGGDSGTSGGTGQTADAQADLTRALADAQAAYDDGQAALAQGDFAAYGRAQDQLKNALDRAADAQRRLIGAANGGASTEQAPGVSASPTPQPSTTVQAPGDQASPSA